MQVQSRSVHFGEHLFTHEVDLYPDTDLDQSGLTVLCKQGLGKVHNYSNIRSRSGWGKLAQCAVDKQLACFTDF